MAFASEVIIATKCVAFVILISLFVNAECRPFINDFDDTSRLVLVRLKRSPNRAFTFSGFNPNTGLAAFATSADYLPTTLYNYQPQSSQQPYASYPLGGGRTAAGESFAPSSTNSRPNSEYASIGDLRPSADESTGTTPDDERKTPSSDLSPPNEFGPQSPSNAAFDQNAITPPKKPKKKPTQYRPPIQVNDDDDDYDDNGKTKSRSSASFNAWFPIVLGSYPSSSPSRLENTESIKEDTKFSAAQKEGGMDRGRLGTTVISNSVSHGRSSVASSHAIAYGGSDSPQQYRRLR